MTDELREKFEAWFRRSNYFGGHEESTWCAWQAAHASRDAEVKALRKRINDAPVYYVPTEKPTNEDGWVQVIGSVKALNEMRGKHVRLVIDTAMRESQS